MAFLPTKWNLHVEGKLIPKSTGLYKGLTLPISLFTPSSVGTSSGQHLG